MNILTRVGGCGLMAVLLLPAAGHASLPAAAPAAPEQASTTLIARGGGGRAGGGASRGGGGGVRSGGTRSGGDRMRVQTGFQGASSGLNRGERRPSGGWSSGVPASGARPSLERPGARDVGRAPSRDGSPALTRPSTSRDLNRGDLNRADINRTDLNRVDLNRTVNRNWTRNVNIGTVDLHPGWARPGWGIARPWNTGWYGGWSSPPWGWWGARAAVWGVGTLATASLINSAVDAAINDQVTYILVPNTSYQLLYGSVTPSGSASVSFAVTANGSTYQLTADCQAGTINGQDPASAAEAELLNAACQVAYGST